jgi:ATP-dependent exoDNAse (exonuclease V) beta subunit
LEATTTDVGRFYKTPSGALYPSVTTVTGILGKDSILAWKRRVGEEVAQQISTRAANRGTRMHKLCEDYLNNEQLESEDFLSFDMFKSLAPILDSRVDNIHMQEVPLYSNYMEVAGRVDVVAEFDGKLSIIDFKTSSKQKKKDWIKGYFMQASCYAVMYEELTGIPVPQIVILIAVEHDKPQIFIEKRNDHIYDFIRLRETYRQLNNR